MKWFSSIFLLAWALCGAADAPNPAYAPVVNNPALPRALLIGDSISIGYTVPVRTLLKDVANVHRPAANCGSSSRAVRELDKWLGGGPWDVVHFNFGLHDAFVENGKHPVPIEEYEQNLRQLIERMRKTGARLVWATTTPIPNDVLLRPRDRQPVHDFYEKDILEYNRVAQRVMEQNGVAINDLHDLVRPRLLELQRKDDIHFTQKGSEDLAAAVARSVRLALAAR